MKMLKEEETITEMETITLEDIDLQRKEDFKGSHGQDHQRPGERVEKTEDKEQTHRLHLQRTEDTDPDLH